MLLREVVDLVDRKSRPKRLLVAMVLQILERLLLLEELGHDP